MWTDSYQEVGRRLPAELAAMSDDELAAHLHEHPGLLADETVMAGVRDHIGQLGTEDGVSAARHLRATGQDRFGPSAADHRGTLDLVRVYGDYARRHDVELPAGTTAYLAAYRRDGGDALAR